MAGKVSFEHAPIVTKWQEEGLATKNRYHNFAFAANNNANRTLDFILQNLK